MDTMESRFRGLPSVDRLMSEPEIVKLSESYPHDLLVDLARQQLELERISIAAGNHGPALSEIVESICARVEALVSPGPRRIINTSGVIIHTNLGRAPLSEEAIAAMNRVSAGYSDLEFDLDSGTRGSRNTHIEGLLCQVTGAEAGLVVNNNASALVLGLTALTKRKEVIISRGQAVEIGGGFRIPEVMRQSGAKLVEVGTTNSTNIQDFEQAIGQRTAALLRVHSSNFKIIGYTQNVTIEELVTLGLRYDLPVFDDLGSGCLLDTTQYGLDPEPMVQQSINLEVGLAFFSGDKLLGGPQAGIIVGKKHLVDKLKRHPLARAVRIDKTGLAGLGATLIHYLEGEAIDKVPVWRMISMPLDEIERRAQSCVQSLGGIARLVDGESMVGGGSLPGGTLPTKLVAIGGPVKKGEQNTAQLLARKLREQEPPVVGRLSGNTLLLDPRTVLPGEEEEFLRALQNAAASVQAN
jgi:L-seryl-tRNA(Ser) seleniumtransferase